MEKMNGNVQDTDFSSLFGRILLTAAPNALLCQIYQIVLCHQSFNSLPTRHSFFHFSDEETESERGSDLAKSHRLGWMELRTKPLDSEDSGCSTCWAV